MRGMNAKIQPACIQKDWPGEEKQMKRFHQNDRRIENEVFILYMPDHELVTASNLRKSANCFEKDIVLFFFY